MTRIYKNRDFDGIYDWPWKRIFSDLEFWQCRFVGVSISNTFKPQRRQTLRNTQFYDCELRGCSLGPAIVENVFVQNLKTNGLFQTWAAVFKHVTLKGKIERIMFSSLVSPGWAKPQEEQAFAQANTTYYATVDWALDISEAAFLEADLRGVPGHLVRRDSETQVLVKREKALQGTWRQLDLSRTYWPTALDFFLKSGAESIVLVAPKRARNFKQLLDGLKALRDAGIAESE